MSGQSPTKEARESVEEKEMPWVTEGTQPEFEMDMPPTKKASRSVEDKDLLPEFETDVDEEFEMKREQARLDKFEEMFKHRQGRLDKLEEIPVALAMHESVDNEKIEEKTEEIEPSQPPKKQKVNPTVGVETQSAIDLEKVLKKVQMASYGSQDNISVMMTGP